MRLWEPKIRESFELLKNTFTCGSVDPAFLHPSHQIPLEGLHTFRAAFGSHRTPQLIGTGARQARSIRGNAHELFLKKRHT